MSISSAEAPLRSNHARPPLQVFSANELASYRRDGFLLAKGLLSADQIGALLSDIDRLLCEKLPNAVPSPDRSLVPDVHRKILQLAELNRPALARVYDSIRKLLPFWSMVATLGEAARALMATPVSGVIFRGCGIRLDLPREDEWRSTWHQEYHSQMSSLNGVTAWFNLVPVRFDMGPVELLRGSHAEGLLPVRCLDPMNLNKNYAKTFVLEDAERLLEKYPLVQYETDVGDVVFLHFLTVHQSGKNRSQGQSRVTCQIRYFDMTDPGAIKNDWVGGWQDGGDFTKVHPEMVRP